MEYGEILNINNSNKRKVTQYDAPTTNEYQNKVDCLLTLTSCFLKYFIGGISILTECVYLMLLFYSEDQVAFMVKVNI